MRTPTSLLLVSSLFVTAAACGGGGSSSGGGAPPAQPANGAPLAFEVVKWKVGAERDGSVHLKGYNFSDKKLAQHVISVRFADKDGNRLKVGVGTPFESETAWSSMSGRDYQCNPKSWCKFEMEMIEVPAATAKAEAAVTRTTALKDDGMTFEEEPLWQSPKGMMSDWPL